VWVDDPVVLFDHPLEFFPSQRYTSEAQLNAIVRCSFYISLVMSIWHKSPRYFWIFAFFLFITWLTYTSYPYQDILPSKALNGAMEIPWKAMTYDEIKARDLWLKTLTGEQQRAQLVVPLEGGHLM